MTARELIWLIKDSPDHLRLLDKPRELMRYAQKHYPEVNMETLTRYAREFKHKPMPEQTAWQNKIVTFPFEQ